MTTVQRVAQIFGVVFLLIGVLGLIPGFGSYTMADVALLGMFPVNVIHNIVHLLFGVWGLMAAKTFAGAVSYARIAGIIYIVLTVLGFVIPEGFEMVHLGGNNVWLHALLGIVLAAVGFTAKPTVVTATP